MALLIDLRKLNRFIGLMGPFRNARPETVNGLFDLGLLLAHELAKGSAVALTGAYGSASWTLVAR